jgi:hypothetical protein
VNLTIAGLNGDGVTGMAGGRIFLGNCAFSARFRSQNATPKFVFAQTASFGGERGESFARCRLVYF